MKKLILLSIISIFTFGIELNAQCIVTPSGEEIMSAFDLDNATNLVLANTETNEVLPIQASNQASAVLNGLSLTPGQYELSYIIGNSQHKIRFYINQD